MRIGILGVGNMGGMLASAFASGSHHQVHIYNRSADKAANLAKQHTSIVVVRNIEELVRDADVLFVCVKPVDGRVFMHEYGALLQSNQIVCPTISSIPVQDWEAATAARVVKMIPSILQSERCGVLLVHYGSRFNEEDMETFESMLGVAGTPFEVEESQMRIASDLASSGPAFLVYLLQQWAIAAANTGRLNQAEAEHLLTHTVTGLAALLRGGRTFKDIITKVAIPGGVTEAGLLTLEAYAPAMFDALHATTQNHSHGARK